MGKSQSKPTDNSGTVVNNVAVKVQQAEIVDSELFTLLYILVAIQIMSCIYKLYKTWHRHVKRRYVTRAPSMDLV